MDALTPWHLLILAGVFVVLFGAKRLPDAARSLGKSARILKTELKDLHEDDGKANSQAAPQVAQLPAVPVVPAAPVVVEAPPQTIISADHTPAP
jgi:sec-independent protein translocase protein TatA